MAKNNLDGNLKVVEEIELMAKQKDISLSQLSLAWVMNQGHDVFPIPSTTKVKHLEENMAAADIKLTKDELSKLSEAAGKIKGERGNE